MLLSLQDREFWCSILQESIPKDWQSTHSPHGHTETTLTSTNRSLGTETSLCVAFKDPCLHNSNTRGTREATNNLGALFLALLPCIVTYGFPAIHGFHPEPPVLFRQRLHGDNPWPAEKGGTWLPTQWHMGKGDSAEGQVAKVNSTERGTTACFSMPFSWIWKQAPAWNPLQLAYHLWWGRKQGRRSNLILQAKNTEGRVIPSDLCYLLKLHAFLHNASHSMKTTNLLKLTERDNSTGWTKLSSII